MEIRRQNGDVFSGLVPVNQKEYTLGCARIHLEERESEALQLVSLRLDLMQENQWLFEGLEQDAPIRVYLPLEPKPEKMTALYLFSDWWTRPAFVERFEDIPPRTQVLLLKNEAGFACLVPMVGRDWKATVNGGTEEALCLELSAGVGGYLSVEEPLYVLAEGESILEAIHRAFSWLAKEKGIPLRSQRRIPEQFRSLGWCSWNAFYTDVDEAGLKQKAAELAEKSVPVRWMIIDDGWMSTEDTFLTGYAPDRKKFPRGFSQMVEDIRSSSTVETFGVWHALGGYWSGVRKGSDLARQEEAHLTACVNGLLVPSPDQGADFYRHWYQLLRQEGIEFVKVDGQSAAARYFENTLPIASAARGLNEALESGASVLDNSILNCMGMAMETVLARPASAVSRNSDDFFPDREGSFAEHLLENAYNALYHDELYCCDWDMFWTCHPDGHKHSLLRAISGGPVYFSDRVGETNPAVLRPLTYLDGSLPMMIRSAKPTEDCVFSDPLKGGVLKLHNAARWGSTTAGGIAVFNLTQEQQPFSFSPCDIPELEKAERYWVYDWFGRCVRCVENGKRFEGTIEAQGFHWYVVLPQRESLSCLGLSEKYVGFTAVESTLDAGESTIVVLRECGSISWLSLRPFQRVEWNGADVTGQVVRSGALYTLPLEEAAQKAVLCVRW
jgi:hypothetical protein